MPRELDPDRIIETLITLGQRIGERFPDSGLSQISRDLLALAKETRIRLVRLGRPRWALRAAAAAAVLILGAVLVTAVLSIRVPARVDGVGALLQAIESAVNDAIFLAVGVYFLFTLEGRLKRREALRGLHQLRSIAHIVDMHQLTKDPEYVIAPPRTTASSPRRTMTRFELSRYLDYCSELLSLTSKLAALHAQSLRDPVVFAAVNDVEALAVGLSGKIWQKIMILDTAVPRDDLRALGMIDIPGDLVEDGGS
ncbi:MAG TPA: hypothetical protein VKA84_10585 [Gemmatimonadaceae bacterium]|nr:hypothetical protein [Gemmatimonadaceae bacterium]